MSILPALLGIGALGLGAAQGNAASKKLERQMRELAGFSKSGQDVYGPGFNFKRGPQGYVTDFSSPFQSQLTSIGKQARQLAQDASRYGAYETDFRDLARRYSSGFSPYQQQMQGLAGDVRSMRPLVAPGMSQLRDARLARVEDARQRSASTLKDSLARRNVMGSSFANQDLTNLDAEFGRLAADQAGQSFLEEMAMTQGLIDREAQMGINAAQMLEAQLGGEMKATGAATDVLGSELGARGTALGIGRDTASTGLSGDLKVLSEAMGGANNMRDWLSGIQQLMSDLAVAQAELASQRGEGMGKLGGSLMGSYTGPYSWISRTGNTLNTSSEPK